MPDLSTAEGRIASAGRPTTNRDTVLPNRRNTDQPGYRVGASMRDAQRSDAGSRDLKRALGMFVEGVGNAAAAHESTKVDTYRAQAAQGSLDASTGAAPAGAMSSSDMYQEAYYGQKAEASFNTFKADLTAKMGDMIASGADPSEVQATFQAAVKGYVEEATTAIPLPSAKLATAERLQALAGDLQVGMSKAIKERTDAEFVTTAQANIQTELASGKPMEFERYVQTFRMAGNDAPTAKKMAADAVMAAALNPDEPHPELLDALLASRQADGKTPSLAPGEQVAIQNAKIQAEGLVDRADRRAREALQKTFFEDAFTKIGTDDAFDPVAAVEHAPPGTFTPEEAMSTMQALRSFSNFREEGDVNETAAIQLSIDTSKPGLSTSARRKLVTDAFNSGRLGTGTSSFRIYGQMMVSINNQAEAEAKAAASAAAGAGGGRFVYTSAEDYLEGYLKPKAGFQYGPGINPAGVASAWIAAQSEFRSRVARGEDPMTASADVVKRYSNLAARSAEGRSQGSTGGGIQVTPGAPRPTAAPRGSASNPIDLSN